MTVSVADLNTMRRRVAEHTEDVYSDAALAALVEAYPLPDGSGLTVGDSEWEPTYDLWAAARDVWLEKAAALAGNFDFSADGASYSRSQAHAHALKQASFCASRRAARGITL